MTSSGTFLEEVAHESQLFVLLLFLLICCEVTDLDEPS